MCLTNNNNVDVRIESMFALCQIINCKDLNLIRTIFTFEDGEVVRSLQSGLKLNDKQLTLAILRSFNLLLNVDEKYNLLGK